MQQFNLYLKYVIGIKANYRWLDDDIREELNQVLDYYLNQSILSKIERSDYGS